MRHCWKAAAMALLATGMSEVQAAELPIWNSPQVGADMAADGCGTWQAAQHHGGNSRNIEIAQASGFLGQMVAYAGARNTAPMDTEPKRISAYIDRFCARHVSEKVQIGVAALAIEMTVKHVIRQRDARGPAPQP